MNRILLFLSLLLSFHLEAQVERTMQWHFGFGLALDFTSGSPTSISGSQQYTFEGCASISDLSGQLLWYTNGGGRDPIQSGQPAGSIWDRNNDVMYDMSYTEGGGYSSAQSAVFITKPGDPDKYYLFTMEEVEFYVGGDVPSQPDGRGLSWFEIDGTGNGGLGEMIEYKENIYGPTYEGLCAVQHANGQDWWIIADRSDLLGFVIVPVTSAGVGTPMEVTTTPLFNNVIKSSPDGKWLTTIGQGGRFLFPFDGSDGIVGSPIQLPEGSQIEFSANSRWLFALTKSLTSEIHRFDLQSSDIPASEINLGSMPAETDGLPYMPIISYPQLGPDQNIYFSIFYLTSTGGTSSYLSAIICANTGGVLAPNHLALGQLPAGTPFFIGLPNFPAVWLAGETLEDLAVNLGQDTILCPDATLSIGQLFPGANYIWSTGDTTGLLQITEPGSYAVTVTTPCGFGADTIQITASDLIANAGPDLVICEGESIEIGQEATGTISWMPMQSLDNATAILPLASPDTTTTYYLSVTEGGCQLTDTMIVNVFPAPEVIWNIQDTTVGRGTTLQVSVFGGTVLSWTPASIVHCLTCNETSVTILETTYLAVEIIDPNGCSAIDSVLITVDPDICQPKLPNVFTPNGDQTNDELAPVKWDTPYQLQVWSRWGNLVYDNKGNGISWDGKVDGTDAPSDIYAWMFTATICGEKQSIRGEVTLVR